MTRILPTLLILAALAGCSVEYKVPKPDCYEAISEQLYEVCFCDSTEQKFRQDLVIQLGEGFVFPASRKPITIRPLKGPVP